MSTRRFGGKLAGKHIARLGWAVHQLTADLPLPSGPTWWPSTGASTAADHSFRVTPLSAASCRQGREGHAA